jgi:SAM-dependent methyltransferase
MRYDFTDQISMPEFSRGFYEEIDRRFFQDANDYMPWTNIPFDPLIDFEALRRQDVLEIGVGNGSHAALLASHAKSFTGIDLTDYAVKSTSERLKCFRLSGRILQMDAEQMSSPPTTSTSCGLGASSIIRQTPERYCVKLLVCFAQEAALLRWSITGAPGTTMSWADFSTDSFVDACSSTGLCTKSCNTRSTELSRGTTP